MKMKQYTKKVVKYTIGFIFCLCFLFYYQEIKIFIQQRIDDDTIFEEFKDLSVYRPEIGYYSFDSLRIRYVSIGDKSKPHLILIHGAPSSSHSWMPYLKDIQLLSKYRLIAVDRLGYGFSEFGNSFISIDYQARSIDFLIDKFSGNKMSLNIMASSYGGPIALKSCILNEKKINKLILVSSPIIPGAEKTFWISKIIDNSIIKELVPKAFKVANEEKLTRSKELSKLIIDLNQLKTPTLIIHGKQDSLIYFENARYLINKVERIKLIEVEERGHFIPWNSFELVKNEMINFLDE